MFGQVLTGYDVVLAMEEVGTPSGRPEATVVIVDSGLVAPAKPEPPKPGPAKPEPKPPGGNPAPPAPK